MQHNNKVVTERDFITETCTNGKSEYRVYNKTCTKVILVTKSYEKAKQKARHNLK